MYGMPALPRTTKGRRTRQKILDAAAKVFARDGYIDSRMLDIATTAGLSTGGLYRYFDNKTEVFAALIADLHEEFYARSGHTQHSLKTEPLDALTEANRGYIEHYHQNRHVMRAFIEAAAVETRFRKILDEMRDRHVRRFAKTHRGLYGEEPVGGTSVEVAAEALACMVEQCCYVWFAQEDESSTRVSVDEAVAITSHAWYASIFAGR
jgi:AcrR family transcriptional regulator